MQTTTENVDVGLMGEYFTEDELAQQLDVATRTLDRWDREGRGPKRTKLGRRVLYKKSTVAAWLGACEADQRDRRFRRKART
jgi:predicted DNA-binding transcriptional regulator AlpA